MHASGGDEPLYNIHHVTRKNESKVACAVERPEMLIEGCEEFDAVVNVLHTACLADAVH